MYSQRFIKSRAYNNSMKFTSGLPTPPAEALKHSHTLLHRIKQEIANHQGAISFRRYMEMALYEPSLGYYVAGARKIGASGDFITAPEISPLFSQCLAHQCLQIFETNKGDILELGAGSGRMAAQLLLELKKQSKLPAHYYILDISPELRQRQQQTIGELAPDLLAHVIWLTELPTNFKGIILGNEVLDAMPIDLFTAHNNQVYEHQVTWQNGKLVEQLNPAPNALQQTVKQLELENNAPYTSEVNPNLDGWLNALSDCLSQGVVILIDYGYTRSEYYHADRNKGTLICHYQHRVNESPFLYPGLQDITANVDFTAVAESADKAGFEIAGYTPQSAFLAANKLEPLFMRTLDQSPEKQYELAQHIRILSLPSEMGERFKVIALTKNAPNSLDGFSLINQITRL